MAFPDWVLQQKKRGYEIKCIRGNYYLYKLKSKWDPERGKARKVSGEYIGKVTPDGIVLKKKKVDASAPVFALEFGAAKLVESLSGDVLDILATHFPKDIAERIYVTAMIRLISPCPFSRVADHYATSWLSCDMPGLALSPSSITSLLDMIGNNRSAAAAFMRDTSGRSPYYLVDGTRTVTASDNIFRAERGHSHTKGFLPQINQVYVMGISKSGGVPVFYRNVAGNIPDVTALKLTLKDAGIKDATFIADTGFASADNFSLLGDIGLDYLVPLKRNTTEVDLSEVVFNEVFTYHGRAISACSITKDKHRIVVFRDEKLRSCEMADFVGRAEKANAAKIAKKRYDPAKDTLHDIATETAEKTSQFGVIIIRTSITATSSQSIYETYKLRWQIEELFDTMRNVCEQDASYMHDDTGFEAWSFIGHITLMVACMILALLKEKKLSKIWSLAGILDHLSRIYAVQVADEWKVAETTKKTRDLAAKLGLDLSIS